MSQTDRYLPERTSRAVMRRYDVLLKHAEAIQKETIRL